MSPVTLQSLAGIVGGRISGPPDSGDIVITDVVHDSRHAAAGSLFVAVSGFVTDGHDHVAAALTAGAAAVCVADDGRAEGSPAIIVADTRRAMGPLAAEVHGHPADRLRMIGITGTNGKTTVAHLLGGIASAAGLEPAVIGTVGSSIAGKAITQPRTTPEATDFHRLLREMVDSGVDLAALEISSHALALGRVAAARFDLGAFTNLSQDHLDFHSDMEDYYLAKRRLFTQSDRGVVWIDDPAGARLASEVEIPLVTVGRTDADVVCEPSAATLDGTTLRIRGVSGGAEFRLRLPGDFNVSNAAVAAACAEASDIEWRAIAAGIESVKRVPGRFEVVPIPAANATVIVDYAHTPEGVASAVSAAARLAPGRVVAVVGAGGDRDRAKRPLMGRAAATADLAVVTSDNPRSEEPTRIVAEVAAGVPASAEVEVEVDRRAAIRLALARSKKGDVVLILGKGHEQGQEIGSEIIPFDDRTVAIEEAAS